MATIDTIRQYFADILQRSGPEVTDAEIASYVSAVDTGILTLAQVRTTMINSPEGQDVQDVVRLYQTVFGRVPDKQGLNDQVDTLRGPATESDLANSFANSPEFITRFGGNSVNPVFINAVYQQVLGRIPSADEVKFYMESGFSAGRIALAFSESPEFQAAYSNAVVTFLNDAGQGTAIYTGPLGGTINVGQAFTLTQGTDAGPDFTGSDKDDTFNAPVEQTAFLPIQTLNNTDNLDGKGGWNVLNAQLVNGFTVPTGLHNIQEVNIEGAPGFVVPPVTLDVINADTGANGISKIGFRAPSNNVTVNNLATALATLSLSDDAGGNAFTVNHVGTGTDGNSDTLALNLVNSNAGSSIALNHAGGGADKGYETVKISSMGGLGNTVAVTSTHGPATVDIVGTANLNLSGNILNVATVDTVAADTFTGDLTAAFTGTGDVSVDSGSGNDMLNFNAVVGNVTANGNDGNDMMSFGNGVNATATGGNGDDTFTFINTGVGITSFTTLDKVDGGSGNNILELGHDLGELLNVGVGAGIVNISRIVHGAGDAANGNVTINMAESGSALEIELGTNYNFNDVAVNNLNNADWVIYSGSNLDDLTLAQAAPDGILDNLNLRLMNGADMDDLIVGPDIEAVTIDVVASTVPGFTTNTIGDADDINSDLLITGNGNLEIGTTNAYDFAGGLVDASAYTGNLNISLGANSQSVIAGTGNDFINVFNFATADQIDISSGGSDTVDFEGVTLNANQAPTSANFHKVLGFSVADDIIGFDEDDSQFSLDATDNNDVDDGDAVNIANYTAGTLVTFAAQNVNLIKFTTAVTGGTADALFDNAIGLGTIGVAAGTNEVMGVLYDSANQQMMVFTVDASNNSNTLIQAADDIDVVAFVGMSQADFDAFNASNFAFLA
ncbi:DUF4214 domain-containing protein [Aurantimonas sp. DM33-3]|uniref:DUF4214 domain-containing protein n=1 Tax=Aurantimonas sp. DM33-3 TaxID=2766955 RepID=UPI0016525ECB|nr:DUF4214 domain-containing protein [Aurantimonas sp. DM33-3]MBC6718652.1 DUF4214 domain-containing protein [Aurantimonas sp. DM33-3]